MIHLPAPVRRETSRLLDLLLPVRCLGCGERVPAGAPGGPVCFRCRSRIRPLPSPRCRRCDLPLGTRRDGGSACHHCADWPAVLVAARCATALADPADRLVHALKYGGWPAVVPVMAGPMAAAARRLRLQDEPRVVPVPTTPRRRRRRGYNQAELLAREVARVRGWACLDALARRDLGGSQIALPVARRRANVEDAFIPGAGAGLLPATFDVILVDDVLTTGATASAAARALEALGARSVALLAFARTLPRDVDPVAAAS